MTSFSKLCIALPTIELENTGMFIARHLLDGYFITCFKETLEMRYCCILVTIYLLLAVCSMQGSYRPATVRQDHSIVQPEVQKEEFLSTGRRKYIQSESLVFQTTEW